MNRKICENYAIGFCPDGPNCTLAHIQCVILDSECKLSALANFPENEEWFDKAAKPSHNNAFASGGPKAKSVICHHCGEEGHKNTYCLKAGLTPEERKKLLDN